MHNLKNLIKSFLPKTILMMLQEVRKKYFQDYSSRSFSQEGEDLVLSRFMYQIEHGFYVDVGAHHPQRFSNTYYYYLRGWRGINIDAMPGSMKAFNKKRPRDINLEFPVSDKEETLTYYIFNEPALNGFSAELSRQRDGLEQFQIIDKKEIRTKTLEIILDEYLPKGQQIDFLSIDVEGLDFNVLRSNNWNKYKPVYILVETLGATIEENLKSPLAIYLDEKGYKMIARSYNTAFFKLQNAE